MKITTFACALAGLLLAGCLPSGSVQLPGSQPRFNIDSYTENAKLASDLTGVWIAIHKGKAVKSLDGVDYDITGSIREVMEISKSNGVYYLRTCANPGVKQVMSVAGSTVSVIMNDELASMTKSSNTFMSGSAAHAVIGSRYSGSVSMKKLAAVNYTFGLFNYFGAGQVREVGTASCFQEGTLHVLATRYVLASQSWVNKWSDVEIASVADWTAGSTYKQVAYLISRAGDADPVKEFQFKDGTVGMDPTIRKYSGNDVKSVTVSSATVTAFKAGYSVGTTLAGDINLTL